MCENTYEKYAMEYQKTLDKNFNLDTIYRKDALHACFDGWNKGFEEIARDIRLLPSAQPERKIGTYTESEENDEWYCWYATCNECGKTWMGSRNFCPNCGVDMRGGL